jgi:hypothetical protein
VTVKIKKVENGLVTAMIILCVCLCMCVFVCVCVCVCVKERQGQRKCPALGDDGDSCAASL